MKYRENVSDEELKEELVFLSLGTAERFETWLESFDWYGGPRDRCFLVNAAIRKVGNQGDKTSWAGRAHTNYVLGRFKNNIMKYRENMSDAELKDELLFLSLGTAERFETWLESFDWYLAPYPHCVLVSAVVEQFYIGPNTSQLGIILAKFRASQRKKAEEDGFILGIIL